MNYSLLIFINKELIKHELKWLGYDFLIAFIYFFNLRASVPSWLIFTILDNQSQNMDTQN